MVGNGDGDAADGDRYSCDWDGRCSSGSASICVDKVLSLTSFDKISVYVSMACLLAGSAVRPGLLR